MSNIIEWARGRLARAGLFLGLLLASALAPAQTVTYYHNDASGTPVLATDVNGNVVWKESYQPYGARLNNPAAEASNPIGFTGKPFDASTGLSYMEARYYDPVVGRFAGIDPAAVDPSDAHSFNRYAYANNNPYKFVDPDGRSGQLVIESSGNGGSSMADGHSWIVFTKDGTNVTTTYGTWGNNPENLGNGLHTNLEAGRTADATRGTHIDDAHEKVLMSKIDEYRKKGADAWQYGAPCSKFSSDTWNTVTGEKLDANWGIINNPTTLKESIIKANGGVAHANGITPQGKKSSGSSTGISSSSASSGSSLNSAGSLLP